MDSESRQQQWQRKYEQSVDSFPSAAKVLADNLFLLPKDGKALDFACGKGGNALLLAEQGLDVVAWDYASSALDSLLKTADTQGLSVNTETRDVEKLPPKKNSFDVIVVSYFLDRKIIPELIAALRPNGVLFYETFLQDAVTGRGPNNPSFRLANNELLQLFSSLKVLQYSAHGSIGDVSKGVRDVAMLVAQKTV